MTGIVQRICLFSILWCMSLYSLSVDSDNSAQPKIIAGQAVTQQWPWMGAVYFSLSNADCSHFDGCYDRFRYTCSAVQIAPNWLLTAAHCLYLDDYQMPLSAIKVHLGSSSIDQQQQLKSITEVILHPQYQGAPAFKHDIALIKLAQPSEFTSLQIIASPAESLIMLGEPLTILGWGRAMIDDFYYYPQSLQFTQLGFVPLAYCAEVFSPMVTVSSSNICAGGDGVKDACDGDSGGPLMIKLAGVWRLLGLVSYGEQVCALSGYPTVFTRVSFYQSWIDGYVEPETAGGAIDVVIVILLLTLLLLPNPINYRPLGN